MFIEKPVPALAVADLHLGFEEELRSKGVKVPLHSPKIVDELASLAEEKNVQKIIVVGDLKHNVRGVSRLEYDILPRLLKPLKKIVEEILIIPGNHDGKIGNIIAGVATVHPPSGLVIEEEKAGFTHGHVKPRMDLLSMDSIFMGHLHPVLKIGSGAVAARLGVWLKLKSERRRVVSALYKKEVKALPGQITLFIMPSFNRILQGRSVTELSESSLVRGPLLRTGAFDINEAEVIGQDGTYLGTLWELRNALHERAANQA